MRTLGDFMMDRLKEKTVEITETTETKKTKKREPIEVRAGDVWKDMDHRVPEDLKAITIVSVDASKGTALVRRALGHHRTIKLARFQTRKYQFVRRNS